MTMCRFKALITHAHSKENIFFVLSQWQQNRITFSVCQALAHDAGATGKEGSLDTRFLRL